MPYGGRRFKTEEYSNNSNYKFHEFEFYKLKKEFGLFTIENPKTKIINV